MLVAGLNYVNSLALFLTFLLAGFALVAMHSAIATCSTSRSTASHPARPLRASRHGSRLLSPTPPVLRAARSKPASIDGVPAAIDLPRRSVRHLDAAGRHAAGAASCASSASGCTPRFRSACSAPGPGCTCRWKSSFIRGPAAGFPCRPKRGIDRGSAPRSAAAPKNGWGCAPSGMAIRRARSHGRPTRAAHRCSSRSTARPAPTCDSSISRRSPICLWKSASSSSRAGSWTRKPRGERYGLTIAAHRIAPDRGPEHRHRCLSALARVGLESER